MCPKPFFTMLLATDLSEGSAATSTSLLGFRRDPMIQCVSTQSSCLSTKQWIQVTFTKPRAGGGSNLIECYQPLPVPKKTQRPLRSSPQKKKMIRVPCMLNRKTMRHLVSVEAPASKAWLSLRLQELYFQDKIQLVSQLLFFCFEKINELWAKTKK